ncbi:hypothetical protein [Nonomuraea sp. KM90]|uniref:hypothetical protein n=1 Tax=Nonomuraea sp. KM90 TaxID=3457428 RepID=UPI003FCCD92A
MAPRVAVLVRPVEGGHQAFCQTHDCTEGPEGRLWQSGVHVVKAGAEDEARAHRQWHRAQRPIPEKESVMATEKITVQWVSDHGLAVVERYVPPERADRIATELLDAATTDGRELLLVRARRGRLSLVDVVVPLQLAARIVADLCEVS